MTIPGFGIFRDSAFRQQLNVAVTVGVLVFALASSLLTSWQGGRHIRATLEAQGRRVAENLASQSTLALLYASPENAKEALDTTMSFPDVTRVEIHHVSGRMLATRGDAVDAAVSGAPFSNKDNGHAFLEEETHDAWRFVAPVMTKGGDSPFEMEQRKEEMLGYVRVVQSKATLTRMLAQVFLINLAISLVFAAALLFVLRRLAGRLTAPITELSEAMARAELGESNVRARIGGPKDIRDMAKAFNSMIAVLEERERALRESQASYREVVEGVKEIIFQTDAAGNWTLLNPAWLDVTGVTVEDALGRPLADFVDAASRPLVMEWQDTLRSGAIPDCAFEIRMTRADGATHWLEITQHARFDADGNFAGTSGIVDDVTDRKLAAERLENLNAELEHRVQVRTAQLEASNRELEAFSYSVSHDLRAPLRAIDGFSRMIEEDYADRLDETGRGYFSRVRAGATRMSQLIDELIELARLSRTNLDCKPTDLSALAEEIVHDLRSAEANRQAEVVVEPGLTVSADAVLMRAALENLLGNAWKYTGRREVAQIVFGAQKMDIDGEEETVYFVRDNGAGFDMAYGDKLFRPFSRLHSANEFSGTGIGLATVQRIVHRHGGRIWAESAPEQGSIFYFTIPEPKNGA